MTAQVVEIGAISTNERMADFLREMADGLMQTDSTPRQIVIITESDDGSVRTDVLGGACDHARAVGLLTIAAHRAMDCTT